MREQADQLKQRTYQFGLDVIELLTIAARIYRTRRNIFQTGRNGTAERAAPLIWPGTTAAGSTYPITLPYPTTQLT
ncbi:MAG: hypothetical protein HY048_03050 [Acidobacteria bacterium]|nr:hypothetical protein [Acidobacteriota bacterium]